ncbi:HNH endonuclease [Rhodopseudomonas sp. P2A-2r]|uniref:HNH endonuclease n=1 Tax=Rhodopseudomonas sp. P2A-2r TaxID=2991972 RepID=UPI0022345BB4|nr:HNH endonuclease signature motif containing protein [Rhodopseudomonas sp. P2A-2r]UZE51888.1 HNH endonuclease [Rhodopseudomonas sp. P2A-2r]
MQLTPKNWKSFQHYKDRSPMWIKLHRGLLDNPDYFRLSPDAGKALPLLWLLASEKDGILPDVPDVAFRLRISEELAGTILAEMVTRKFFVDATHAEQDAPDATPAQRVAKANGFGSRHIPDEVKRLVWERDGGCCVVCEATENVEYDHKIPVSKGGPSTFENVQLLCRTCNRRKRVHVATQAPSSRSLEKNREEKRERQRFGRSLPRRPALLIASKSSGRHIQGVTAPTRGRLLRRSSRPW